MNTLPVGGEPVQARRDQGCGAAVGEKSIVSRTGGAPTLAIGMSEVLHQAFGGAKVQAFWYHFAIMFEALFILTTVDAGTRVARFMLSDGLGNLGRPLRKLRNPSWRAGAWLCSFVVVAAWGGILLMGVTDPLGGINTLFPLFGIANQLLAAIALTVVTVVVVKKGYLKWAWIPGVPLLWDLTVTMTASWQKIFSGRPDVGYWTQHHQCRDAQDAGKTRFGTAKNAAKCTTVIRNTFIQGTLSIVFAVLVVIVFVAGVIVALRAIRGGGTPADRGRAGAVATLRTVWAHTVGENGRCRRNGTCFRHRPPDRLVLRHIDGRHALPALRRASAPHAPRRARPHRTRVLEDAPRRHRAQSGGALLLAAHSDREGRRFTMAA